jgi:predicted HAD superfamily Cof-like phosphohydrolase
MSDMQQMVMEWHRKFDIVISGTPQIRRASLRCELIREEAAETIEAIERGDLVEAIDGMCDLLYVTFGAAVEFGVDLTPFFAEVHRTNMAKEGGSTRQDGKFIKPEGWQKPRIAEMLAEITGDSLR